MGMDIYCQKKIRDEKEHLFWILKLEQLNQSEYYCAHGLVDKTIPFELSFTYNSNDRTLLWGGWSLKCRKGFNNYDGIEDWPTKSRSLKKLLEILPQWKDGDKEECQQFWARPWDKTSYWFIG